MIQKDVLIVDDHPAILKCISEELRKNSDTGELVSCSSPQEAIEIVKSRKFDLYILDLSFPSEKKGFNTIRCFNYIREIGKIDPQARIIVFTMSEDYLTIRLLFDLGSVKGLVQKGSETMYLQEAVKHVLKGERYFCPRFRRLYDRSKEIKSRMKLKNGKLTDTEVQILKLTAKGMVTKEIAKEMGFKASTIDSYRRDLKEKMNVTSSYQMITLAIIYNYISFDELVLDLLDRID